MAEEYRHGFALEGIRTGTPSFYGKLCVFYEFTNRSAPAEMNQAFWGGSW
jgi:hypothetical protein